MLKTPDAGRSRLPRRCPRRARRADPVDPRALALRPARVGIVRRHHPARHLLSDPHRDRAAQGEDARDRRARLPRLRDRRVRLGQLDQDPAAARGDAARAPTSRSTFRAIICATARRASMRSSPAFRSIRSRPTSPRRSPFPPRSTGMPRLGFFPGSTIGNFVPRSATDLLRHFRDILGTGSKLLIGMDRVKPVERLIAAYDDPQGVTAEFNLNLLERINRELGADIDDRRLRASRALARHERPRRDAPRRHRATPASPSTASASPSPRARASTPRTATNMARAAPASCSSPAAGPRSPNGPTRRAISR